MQITYLIAQCSVSVQHKFSFIEIVEPTEKQEGKNESHANILRNKDEAVLVDTWVHLLRNNPNKIVCVCVCVSTCV